MYKPFGMTAYGRRRHEQRHPFSPATFARPATSSTIEASSTSRWMYLSVSILLGMMLLFVLLHVTGGMGLH